MSRLNPQQLRELSGKKKPGTVGKDGEPAWVRRMRDELGVRRDRRNTSQYPRLAHWQGKQSEKGK